MTERPILFSGEMVRAILAGRKTQTRRLVNPQPPRGTVLAMNGTGDRAICFTDPGIGPHPVCVPPTSRSRDHRLPCPYGVPGDRLWVRETWGLRAYGDMTDWCTSSVAGWTREDFQRWGEIDYRADWGENQEGCRWRPAIHMPRWASRITLEIDGVRVQRLQDLSEVDAQAEGCRGVHGATGQAIPGPPLSAREDFERLWDRLNAERAPWRENPWVWAITFRVCPAAPMP